MSTTSDLFPFEPQTLDRRQRRNASALIANRRMARGISQSIVTNGVNVGTSIQQHRHDWRDATLCWSEGWQADVC
jgi:hypothetical protein